MAPLSDNHQMIRRLETMIADTQDEQFKLLLKSWFRADNREEEKVRMLRILMYLFSKLP